MSGAATSSMKTRICNVLRFARVLNRKLKSALVIVSQYVVQRDPRWWPDPTVVDLDRIDVVKVLNTPAGPIP